MEVKGGRNWNRINNCLIFGKGGSEMKRFLTIVVAVSLAILLFATLSGCGGDVGLAKEYMIA